MLTRKIGFSLTIAAFISQKSRISVYCDGRRQGLKPLKIPSLWIEKKRDKKSIWARTLSLLEKTDYLLLSSILVVTFTSAAISIYTPVVIGNLVTVVQSSITAGTVVSLNKPALNLMTMFCANGLLTWIDITLVTQLGESIAFKLKTILFTSILHKDMAFFDSRMNGEITARLNADVNEFKHTFKIVLTQGLKATAQIVGSVYALLNLSSSLSLTLLTTLPPLYLFMNFYGSFLRKLSRLSKRIESTSNSTSSEAIQNIKTVRAFQAENLQVEKYSGECEKTLRFNSLLG